MSVGNVGRRRMSKAMWRASTWLDRWWTLTVLVLMIGAMFLASMVLRP